MLIQTAVFIIVVSVFNTLELRRPRNRVDRRYDLPLNLTALSIVIFAGEAWKILLVSGFDAFNLGAASSFAGLHNLPGGIKILFGVILGDLALYWVHRAMHASDILWRTHVFHHSIKELWWLSGSRTSFIHLLLFAIPQTLIGYYFLELAPLQASVAFSAGIFVNVWIHTNTSVSLGPPGWLFITPDYHRVHHGAEGLSRKNLGFVLTVWDRLFGTYIDPRTVGKDFPLGFAPTNKGLIKMIIGF